MNIDKGSTLYIFIKISIKKKVLFKIPFKKGCAYIFSIKVVH